MAKNLLRSPAVIIGGVLALVATTACVCGLGDDDDDDDCGLGTPGTAVFAAGTSLRMAEPPAASAELIPASGGFGTHLASCGG